MALNYCSNCGKQTFQGDKYCSSCGQKLTEKENDNTLNSVTNVESLIPKILNMKSKIPSPFLEVFKSKKGLITVGAVIVTFILVFSLILGKQSPSDVAKEFIKDTQEENYDKAKELWSQAGIDYMLSQLGDERWIYQNMKNLSHRTYGDLSEFEITKEEKVASDKATVYAKFIFDSGKHEDVQIAMIKEDGKWRVYAFGSN